MIVVAMAVWRNVGTLMIIFLAGLQAVPEEVQEAAVMDGASPWRRLISVTLPLLRPTLLLGSVLISVGFLQFFEEAFVMTRGGPDNASALLLYYIYQVGFSFWDSAYAAALTVVVLAVLGLTAFVKFRFLDRRTHYQ